MIIDATDLLVGRMATEAAKLALKGEKVMIINCDKAVISGNRQVVFAKYRVRRERGGPQSGPYYPRTPAMLVKRIIRGMLPHHKTGGKAALQRIRCYVSAPTEMGKDKAVSMEHAHMSRLRTVKYVTIAELSKFLGGSK